MANKSTQKIEQTESPVTVSFKGYTQKMNLAVMPLNHDILLGKTWCEEHEAVMNLAVGGH